jgi:signal peptidase I
VSDKTLKGLKGLELMIILKNIITVIFGFALLSGCSPSSTTTYLFEGNSMLPTINDQDKLEVDETYYEENEVKTGDIIVFEYGNNSFQIKRVLGKPGELIQIENGKVLVNSKPVNPEFVFNDISADEKMEEGITLKRDEYFVIGDNPEWSKDSRNDGPINGEMIIGKVLEINSK